MSVATPTDESPPSPTPAKRCARRSSVARARRLSRASGAGLVSLEEQLSVVPGRGEEGATTADRLRQTVNMCLNATARQIVAVTAEEEEGEEGGRMADMAQELANFLRQTPLIDETKAKELAKNIDTAAVRVAPEDLVPARVRAVRDYTERLNKEAQEWRELLVERRKQFKNAEENATAAANGEILVDDSQKFSLTAKEKIFFKNLPNYSAALGQVAAHERRQAVAARNVATEVKRLKRRLEEADDELNNAAKLVIRKADRIAEVVSSDDPRDLLLADDAVDEVGDVRDIIEEVEAQRNMLAMKTAE